MNALENARIRGRIHGLGSVAILCGLISSAGAQVIEPNGDAVPKNANLANVLNGQPVDFTGMATARPRTELMSMNPDVYVNEGIANINSYQVEPQQFAPLCDFSVRYIYKGGGARFGIGWYNVNKDDGSQRTVPPVYKYANGDINQTAPDSDIILLVKFLKGDGTDYSDKDLPLDISVQNIRMDSHYKNGLIGLALVPKPKVNVPTCCAAGVSCVVDCKKGANPPTDCCDTGSGKATQYHYTEHKWNVQCTMCTTAPGKPGPWYSHLIYNSTKLANTFYLGFEDLDFLNLDGAAGVNDNDLDFEDFTFQFTGLVCVGAGKPCTDPSRKGACQFGVTECDKTGKPTICKQLTQPIPEVCDGVDNDCDGMVDNGATCPDGQSCQAGHCTTSCSDEFPCSGSLACDRGRCVDQACVGMTCNAPLVCSGGACVDPCNSGIKCPAPTFCSGGTCVDPCTDPMTGAEIVCKDDAGNPDPHKTCQNGACVATCDCLPCEAGKACQSSTGKCVDPACVSVTCPTGQRCTAGTCSDPCTGAVCPTGQSCSAGKCRLPCDGKCRADQMCQNDACVTPCNGDFCIGNDVCMDGKCINPDLGTVPSGCSCHLASNDTGSSALALTAAMLLFAFTTLRRTRRKSA